MLLSVAIFLIVGSRGQDYDASNANFADSAGAAYIFERDGSDSWNFVQKLVAPNRASGDVFGESVAISSNFAVVVAPLDDEDADELNPLPDAGSAFIYERDGSGTWNFVQKITAGVRGEQDRFGQTGKFGSSRKLYFRWRSSRR